MKTRILAALLVAFAHSTFAQAPEIILPSKQKQDDSRDAATREIPRELIALGNLVTDVLAWFPMDTTERGGLRWSRKPIAVKASDKIAIRTEAGRTFSDFSGNGANLVFDPPLDLGNRYTLAAWVQTPMPHNHDDGVIWSGQAGDLLVFKKQALEYRDISAKKSGTYAKTAAPLTGWHHVAITCDGIKTFAYLNGIPLDSAKGTLSKDLRAIGNNPAPQHQHWMMAAGIDENYIFTRPLTPEEIKRLMLFSQPKK